MLLTHEYPRWWLRLLKIFRPPWDPHSKETECSAHDGATERPDARTHMRMELKTTKRGKAVATASKAEASRALRWLAHASRGMELQ